MFAVDLKVNISEFMIQVGLVGRTGAGKSTLASLILRVVEPSKGKVGVLMSSKLSHLFGVEWINISIFKVLLDGVDTALLGLQQLRRSVTIVPQVRCFLVVLSQNSTHICLNQIFKGLCDIFWLSWLQPRSLANG